MKIKPIEDGNSDFESVIIKTDRPDVKPTPHCIKHGAMNKVAIYRTGEGVWRCCTSDGLICRTGCISEVE